MKKDKPVEDPKKKLIIEASDLRQIRELGIQFFHENAEFGGAQGLELSTLLVLKGIEKYLQTKKVEVPFEVKIKVNKYRY